MVTHMKLRNLVLPILAVGLFACGASMSPQDKSNLEQYKAQDSACIVANAPSKDAIDACRATAKAHFESKEAALYPDGGFTAGDANK